jgi:hypothetical protein
MDQAKATKRTMLYSAERKQENELIEKIARLSDAIAEQEKNGGALPILYSTLEKTLNQYMCVRYGKRFDSA